MRTATVCFLLAGLAVCASAQPTIRAASVVNAANNLQAGLPNAGLAQGSMFILKGTNLAAKGLVIANSFPLQTSMSGTSMKITVGSTTVNVIMAYVYGGLADEQGPFDQLAGIVPSNTPPGNGTLTVTYNSATSAVVPVTILANGFGIFTINQQGTGPGVFTDVNYKVNTLVNSAHAGESWFIWGSGLGAISGNDAAAPPVGNLNVPVDVYVGGVKAVIGYQGRSGCCSGIDQILITIPAGVAGCWVPVVVKIGGIVSNFTTMSIAQSGSVCADPRFSVSDLQKAQTDPKLTIADIILYRFNLKLSAGGMSAQGVLDDGEGHFRRYDISASGVLAAVPNPAPSVGCIVNPIASSGTGLFDNFQLSPDDNNQRGVDAGPALNINGPTGAKQLLRRNDGGSVRYKSTGGMLGGGIPGVTAVLPEYLVPGSYTVNDGSGGADVGAFSATVSVQSLPANFWANMDAVTDISRSQDLTLNLNPAGDNVFMLLIGVSSDGTRNLAATIGCLIPGGATTFTIPSYVLSALPASGLATDVPGVRTAFLAVGGFSANGPRVQTRGIDAGTVNSAQAFVKNVNFQ